MSNTKQQPLPPTYIPGEGKEIAPLSPPHMARSDSMSSSALVMPQRASPTLQPWSNNQALVDLLIKASRLEGSANCSEPTDLGKVKLLREQ